MSCSVSAGYLVLSFVIMLSKVILVWIFSPSQKLWFGAFILIIFLESVVEFSCLIAEVI